MVTRLNIVKTLDQKLKAATRMPSGKLSLYVKCGTSDASSVGSPHYEVKNEDHRSDEAYQV